MSKKHYYRLVQLRVNLVIAFVKLGQEILELLNMAFNYTNSKFNFYVQL